MSDCDKPDCWAQHAMHLKWPKVCASLDEECNRAARNLAFALACVATWTAADKHAREHRSRMDAVYWAIELLRRSGLWTERGK